MRTLPGDVLVLTSRSEVMVSYVRRTWDQRSNKDDPGNQDLFRQYYRDKEMSEVNDPFLLIRGRCVKRKGLLPPPLLRQWRGFHICVGSWRYEGTCILFGWRQKRGTSSIKFCLSFTKLWENFLLMVLEQIDLLYFSFIFPFSFFHLPPLPPPSSSSGLN